MRRKFLSVVLCVCMMMTMAPFAFAAGTDTGSNTEESGTSIPANSSSGAGGDAGSVSTSTTNTITNETDLKTALNNASDGDTITISDTIYINAPLVITKTVTLTGGSIIASDSFNANSNELAVANLVSLKTADKTLTLKDITLNGNGKALVVYSNAGKVVVDGATITGGKTNSYVAGVYMTNASQFEMNSGSITGNEVGDDYKNDGYTQYASDLWIGANANGALTSINGGTIGNIFVNSNAWSASNPGGFTMTDGNVENLYVEYDDGYGASFTYQGGIIDNLHISTTNGNGDCKKVTPVIGMAYVGGQTNEETTTPVAKIDETGYATLANAVAMADGKTVTLLKNVTEKVVIPAGKTVTLDLNGNKIQAPTDGRYDAIDNGGTLTIKDSKKTGEIVSTRNIGIGVYANSNTTIDYAKVTGQEGAVGGFKTTVGATVTINDGEFKGIDNAVVIFNGTKRTGASNEITINGGTFTGTIQSDGYVACGIYAPWNDNITVNGGIFNITGGAGIVARAGNITVNGGEFHTTGSAVGKVGDSRVVIPCSPLVFDSEANYPALTADSKITVTGGKFSSDADIVAVKAKTDDSTKRIVISGGYFNKGFSNDFCATGLTVIGNNDDTYKYTVGTIEAKGDNEIKTDTKAGTTQAAVSNEINEENQTAAQAAGASVKPTTLTDSTPITETDKNQALTELVKNNKINLVNGEIPAGTTVTVVKEIYLDVTVTAYDTENNTVSMNIVPKYNLIAVANNDSGNQKVTLKSAQDTTVSSATVTVKIPAFADKKVYINHADKNLYVATAQTDGTIEFTTNGFSPFTFSLSNSDVVAEVNGNAYKSLQEAADAAKDGEEITVVKNDKLDLNFTATKSVKVTNKTSDKITVKFNGVNRDVAKDATETFSYTRPSSGSGSTSYAVNVNAATNGAVAADKKTASKGTTVTVTASPSKGYVVDGVKVVDKDGKDVAVTGKDGKYVFTMPASAVTVTGSFKAETPAPVALPFTDVKSGNWFYDAVKYAYAQGLMTGTSATTFAPNGTMNRAMIVTVLYRLEKSPAVTGASKFTDVPAGQWYSDAVAWAAANKIVNGYDETTFGPMNAVTREQMAAILFRYEQYKGLENVTLEENLNRFPDQNKISAYAIPALQWAVGQKIINGNADGTLDPTGTATRAQVAQIFTNLLNK